MFTFGVQVEFATRYPIGAHETTYALIASATEWEACLIAAQIAACRPECIMPVSTKILTMEL